MMRGGGKVLFWSCDIEHTHAVINKTHQPFPLHLGQVWAFRHQWVVFPPSWSVWGGACACVFPVEHWYSPPTHPFLHWWGADRFASLIDLNYLDAVDVVFAFQHNIAKMINFFLVLIGVRGWEWKSLLYRCDTKKCVGWRTSWSGEGVEMELTLVMAFAAKVTGTSEIINFYDWKLFHA